MRVFNEYLRLQRKSKVERARQGLPVRLCKGDQSPFEGHSRCRIQCRRVLP